MTPTEPDTPTPIPRKKQWPLAIIAAVIFVVGLTWLWNAEIKNRLIAKRFGVVEVGEIYRSGQISSSLIRSTLEEYHIRRIVALTAPKGTDDQTAEEQAAGSLGVKLERYPLSGDGTGDISRYADAIEAMFRAREKHDPVLLHCDAGTQRTGGVVAMYRVLIEGWPAGKAYEEMTRYGLTPQRDRVLLDYLNAHMAELAGMLQKRGLIDHVPDPLPVIGP